MSTKRFCPLDAIEWIIAGCTPSLALALAQTRSYPSPSSLYSSLPANLGRLRIASPTFLMARQRQATTLSSGRLMLVMVSSNHRPSRRRRSPRTVRKTPRETSICSGICNCCPGQILFLLPRRQSALSCAWRRPHVTGQRWGRSSECLRACSSVPLVRSALVRDRVSLPCVRSHFHLIIVSQQTTDPTSRASASTTFL